MTKEEEKDQVQPETPQEADFIFFNSSEIKARKEIKIKREITCVVKQDTVSSPKQSENLSKTQTETEE